MRNVVLGVCNGTIFMRVNIFTMRNLIFGFAMVQNRRIGHKKRIICLVELREHKGDGFFYHDKREFRICNGKKCKRSNFLAMRKVNFRIFMVKLCQGCRAETCEPFFVALMDVSQAPRRLRALHGPNFVTLSLSRGHVRMNHNRMGTSSHGMFPCSLCLHGKRDIALCDAPWLFTNY